MTYLLLDVVFLLPVAALAIVAALVRRPPRWSAVGLVAAAVVLLTVVFDNVIVATGIVAYDPTRISGIRMPIAPIEDLSYAIAAAVLLPTLWSLLPRRTSPGAPAEERSS